MALSVWKQRILAVVFGGAVGRVALLLVPTVPGDAAPSSVDGSSASAAAAARAACASEAQAAQDRVVGLRAERRALDLQERLLRGQTQLVGGVPVPWSDAVDPALTEAELVPRLEALDAATPAVEVLDVDCSEFPCLILVETTGPETASAGYDNPGAEAFSTALGLNDGVYASKVGSGEATRAFALLVAHPGETDPLLAKRLEVRTAEAMKRGREMLTAPQRGP